MGAPTLPDLSRLMGGRNALHALAGLLENSVGPLDEADVPGLAALMRLALREIDEGLTDSLDAAGRAAG